MFVILFAFSRMEKSLQIILILVFLLPLGCFIVFCCCSNIRDDIPIRKFGRKDRSSAGGGDIPTKKFGRKNRRARSHSLDVNSDEVEEDHNDDGQGAGSGGCDVEGRRWMRFWRWVRLWRWR